MRRNIIFLSLVLVFVSILSTEARANYVEFNFAAVTNNSMPEPISAIESQLSLVVTNADYGGYSIGSGQVGLILYNTGPLTSEVAEIYVDDGVFAGVAPTIVQTSSGFANSPPLAPGNLPGAPPGFVATALYSADNGNGDGLDNGESVALVFDLASGKTWSDIMAAINEGFINNYESLDSLTDLAIGLHVRSIGSDGQSQSFVMTPLPATILLGLLGLGMGGWKLRKSL